MEKMWGTFTKVAELFNTSPENARYLLSALSQGLAAVVSILVSLSFVAVQMGDKSLHNYRIEKLKKNLNLIVAFLILPFIPLGIVHFIGTVPWWLQAYKLLMIYELLLLALFLYLLGHLLIVLLDRKSLTNEIVSDLFKAPQKGNTHKQTAQVFERFDLFWETTLSALNYRETAVAELLLKTLIEKLSVDIELAKENLVGSVIRRFRESLEKLVKLKLRYGDYETMEILQRVFSYYFLLLSITKDKDLSEKVIERKKDLLSRILNVYTSAWDKLLERTDEDFTRLRFEIFISLTELLKDISDLPNIFESTCPVILKSLEAIYNTSEKKEDKMNLLGMSNALINTLEGPWETNPESPSGKECKEKKENLLKKAKMNQRKISFALFLKKLQKHLGKFLDGFY